MKLKLPLIAAFVGALSLTACGGGSSGDNGNTAVTVDNPSTLVITDVTQGSGVTVANGMSVTVTYAAYLYKVGATESKGKVVDPGALPLTFTVGAGSLIPGVEQGILGMKVGGHRQLAIPANLAYGATGYGAVPPNSGLLFDMTLTAAK